MFGRKLKELEAKIALKDDEIALMNERMQMLNAELRTLRANESAVAGALTHAQRTAADIINAAEYEREQCRRKSDEECETASKFAETIIINAEAEAAQLLKEAREQAKSIAIRAEAFMDGYRASAKQFVARIGEVAEAAARQAEEFRTYMESVTLQDELELTTEYADIASLVDSTEAQDLPDSYENPALLMRNIYNLQNRNIPEVDEPKPEQYGFKNLIREEETSFVEELVCDRPTEAAEITDEVLHTSIKIEDECDETDAQTFEEEFEQLLTVGQILDNANESEELPKDENLKARLDELL